MVACMIPVTMVTSRHLRATDMQASRTVQTYRTTQTIAQLAAVFCRPILRHVKITTDLKTGLKHA
jgi:hypothetical protein